MDPDLKLMHWFIDNFNCLHLKHFNKITLRRNIYLAFSVSPAGSRRNIHIHSIRLLASLCSGLHCCICRFRTWLWLCLDASSWLFQGPLVRTVHGKIGLHSLVWSPWRCKVQWSSVPPSARTLARLLNRSPGILQPLAYQGGTSALKISQILPPEFCRWSGQLVRH